MADHKASFICTQWDTEVRDGVGSQLRTEIKDAGDKQCTGHGWTSIRSASVKIYSSLFMQQLTSAFKPNGQRELVVQRGVDWDERDKTP